MTLKRRKGQVLTPLELEVMQALWDAGASTVAEVQGRLGGGLAYTTVQTMLNILVRKKQVRRKPQGRAFCYEAVVSRQKASGGAIADLLHRMFSGSAEDMVMAMVEARQITPEEIERLGRRLAEHTGQARSSSASGSVKGGR